ncbi:ABC transporter substrate-binding protein, partial [Intestinimonas massiliensis]|nr:ABC transporter substrate-binding protein [Intestinimonas massiliensis (ex Afouda et al. 2020)]
MTLTLWHNFGGQMQTTMDALVDEFTGTVGKENGVILSVTSISGSASVQEKLTMIAAGDPGAPE